MGENGTGKTTFIRMLAGENKSEFLICRDWNDYLNAAAFFFLCLSLTPLVRIYSLGLLKSDEQERAGDGPEVSYHFEV